MQIILKLPLFLIKIQSFVYAFPVMTAYHVMITILVRKYKLEIVVELNTNVHG